MWKETVVHTDEATLFQIQEVARRENRAMDEIIVEALTEYLKRYRPKQKQSTSHALPGFVGMLHGKENDVSEQAENILAEEWMRHLAEEDTR